MMMAAGLSTTWVFKKARTLAVLDDLVTILFLVPLQIVVAGFHWETMAVLALTLLFIFCAFRWKNSVAWPTTKAWLLGYALLLSSILLLLKHTTNIHLEVLIPAFTWGCLLRHAHSAEKLRTVSMDTAIKGLFMFLVGLSFPKIATEGMPLKVLWLHVLALTVLSNLGKSFLFLCYRHEATPKERLALSIAMFPRGEVGAAVLLIGIGYGLAGTENTLAMLGLALNLVLSGVFIWMVMKLLPPRPQPQS
jgi:hypothetical protein